MSPEQSPSCRAPQRPGDSRAFSPAPAQLQVPLWDLAGGPAPVRSALSALRPLAPDSGLTPASRPDSAPGEAESAPRHVPRPRALLPRGRARVKVSALSARSAAFWRCAGGNFLAAPARISHCRFHRRQQGGDWAPLWTRRPGGARPPAGWPPGSTLGPKLCRVGAVFSTGGLRRRSGCCLDWTGVCKTGSAAVVSSAGDKRQGFLRAGPRKAALHPPRRSGLLDLSPWSHPTRLWPRPSTPLYFGTT